MAAILAGQFRYRARLERSLEEREERYRLLAENIADIVIVSDVKGRMRYVSHSVSVMLGIEEETLIGRFCTDLVHEDDREALAKASADLKDVSGSRAVRFRTWRKNGELVWLESNFKLAQASEGGPFEIVSILRDITKQKKLEDDLCSANQRLSQLATTDGLTGLANRRRFDSFLREAYDTHSALSVLLIDIDHFKGFNDTLGHQAGDGCLRRIASVIGSMTTETGGLAARYGGEEFAVVLPNVSEEDAVTVANAMRLLVRKLDIVHPAASRGYVTISVGVACKSTSSADDTSLVREADIALYQAKEQGRNRTVGSSEPRQAGPSPPLVPSFQVSA
jgi:diguanylate cyclase (GGDEF)-like protein/PAS domain S-box-containing protein